MWSVCFRKSYSTRESFIENGETWRDSFRAAALLLLLEVRWLRWQWRITKIIFKRNTYWRNKIITRRSWYSVILQISPWSWSQWIKECDDFSTAYCYFKHSKCRNYSSIHDQSWKFSMEHHQWCDRLNCW